MFLSGMMDLYDRFPGCMPERGSWTGRGNALNHLWTGVCMNSGKLVAAVLNLKRDRHRHKGGGKGADAMAFQGKGGA